MFAAWAAAATAPAGCGGDESSPAAVVGLSGGALVRVDAETDEAAAPEHVSRTPTHLDSDGKFVWFVQTSPPTDTLFGYELASGMEQSILLPDGTVPTDVVTGAGAVWVAGGNDTLVRVDPGKSPAVMAIALNSERLSTGDTKHVAYGHGSVWVASAASKKMLVRVDPSKNAVVASVDLAGAGGGAYGVAAGEGAVFVITRAPGTLWKIDPGKNEVARKVALTFEPPLATAPIAVGLGAVFLLDLGAKSVVKVTTALDKTEPWDLGYPPGAVAVGHGSVWVAIKEGRREVRRMVDGATKKTYVFDSVPVGLAAVP